MSDTLIRDEQASDGPAVRSVNEQAFGGREEADLVEALHRAQAAVVALVAETGGGVVGHILFSPVDVEHSSGRQLVGLAPMAVDPRYQKQASGARWSAKDSPAAVPQAWTGSSSLGTPSITRASASCPRISWDCGVIRRARRRVHGTRVDPGRAPRRLGSCPVPPGVCRRLRAAAMLLWTSWWQR